MYIKRCLKKLFLKDQLLLGIAIKCYKLKHIHQYNIILFIHNTEGEGLQS